MKSSRAKTRKLVLTAVFIALMLTLQLTGIGLIRLGFINITFYCTIISIGTMVLGLGSGMTLGFAFGAVSFYSALTAPSGMVAPLLSQSWILAFLLSFVPRLLVPLVVWETEKLFVRLKKEKTGLVCAAVAGSLTNTVLYLGLMLLFYAVTVADYPGLLAAVGSVVLCGGLPEAVAAGIVAPPVTLALRKIR